MHFKKLTLIGRLENELPNTPWVRWGGQGDGGEESGLPGQWLSHHLPVRPRRGCYSPHGAYAGSKLALVLFTYHLQRLLAAQGSPITANAADPGVVNTGLYKHVFWGTRLVKKLFGRWLFKVSCPPMVGGFWVCGLSPAHARGASSRPRPRC